MQNLKNKVKYPWLKERDQDGYSDLSMSGIYSNVRWITLRNHKLQLNPLCEHCEKEGIIKGADLVDHKVPVYSVDDPLMYDLENTQSLCNTCHRRKTRKDHSKFSDKNLAIGKKIMDMFESE